MTHMKSNIWRIALAAIGGIGVLFVSDQATSIKSGSLITEARAVIGRPLTPLSYAGVARRTTYRAYGAAVAAPIYAAPVYAAPVVYGPACAQVVNAYGQITMVCR